VASAGSGSPEKVACPSRELGGLGKRTAYAIACRLWLIAQAVQHEVDVIDEVGRQDVVAFDAVQVQIQRIAISSFDKP
jgi:hypothetical protein